MATHRIDPSRETCADVFDRGLPPVLEVEPGDSLVVRSLDAAGYLEPQTTPGEQPPTMFGEFRGHCLVGPVQVAGAVPGTHLAVRLDSLTPDPWGWTYAAVLDTPLNRRLGVYPGEPAWLLWDLDGDPARGTNQHGSSVALAPFLGVVGVAPAQAGEHSTIPPRTATGGNIDCRDLVAGTTLYLPVQVDGALLSLGDGHAAQGHGEVSGTAIECGMTTEVAVDVAEGRPVPGVHARTPEGRLTFGFGASLDDAMADALGAMLTWMERDDGLDRATALALASTVVDLRVTQVVNQTWGVHAVLADGALS